MRLRKRDVVMLVIGFTGGVIAAWFVVASLVV
jgi:hypothetical protein